jgi:hypothetical protein
MVYKNVKLIFVILLAAVLSGCLPKTQETIINSHAEAFLTKNNELQFRFKINEEILSGEDVYKVKVSIHNEKLAKALGKDEIIYGSNYNYAGEYIEVKNKKDHFISMNPIPLLLDLHVFEIEEMIVNEDAVSVEVYNDEEVIGKAFLTNFSSQF